ncbi:uncharacterized protein [Branchiostoma lanceolatum]|uniref:uncharacterized protein isoform X2 n=1 Tax=Branchiostoma lanceolatum TaxID=7740 RepID=UPI003452CAA5
MSFSLKPDSEYEFGVNSYDAFMKKHLQHYGYYTGRNEGYRSSFSAFEQWQRTRGYRGGYSDHDAMDVDEEDEYENHALVKTVKRSNSVDNRLCDDLLRKTTQIVFHYQHGKRVPKLREPRNLYALTKESGPQQAPRFPAEMPVLKTRMKHIEWTPPFREPFYVQTNQERTPMVRGIEGEGRVVYFCETLREAYFMRSRVGGSRGPLKDITVKLKDENDKTLIFESRFESGNLMKVVQVGEFEYELYLRQDLYTDKHTQWYYFRVQNARKGHSYRFTIVNLLKGGSLYNMGLKPLMYSEHDAQTKKTGWLRVGENIKYYKNNVRINLRSDKCYYSLTWTCSFPNDNDSYFFSHCYPYTYSDLQDYLLKMANDPVRSKYCRQRVLCRTLAGNLVYVLTITNPSKNPEDAKVKKAVVLSARVHPGETNASWMMKGFLDYLSGNSADAKLLRDTFIFKIVPMLNPDGVIVGNYRCSLAGRDLNRNYKSVLKESFPSVWHTKMMVRRLCEEREVIVYCDLHGHSRKQNVFIYGCENRYDPEKRLKERVFPLMMQKNAGEKFSYNGCKFKVQKSKDGTGRIVMWHTGIMNAYTMEATFAGSTRGKMKGYHFNTADFEAMGYHFCDTLLDYCDPDRSKANQVMQELQDKLRQEILRRIELSGKAPPVGDPLELEAEFGSDLESDTSGSDSSVDDGLPVHLLAIAPKLNRKKKLRSRKERNKNRNKEIKTKPSKSEDNKEQSEEKKKPKPQSADKRPIRTQHSDVHSARKRRDDRSNNGIPVFADERVELRSARKTAHTECTCQSSAKIPYTMKQVSQVDLPGELLNQVMVISLQKSKTDYLEAITQAYLRSGVMLSNEQAKEVPHFRYASGQKHLIEGLCPQHDQNFAANYVANHLSDNYSGSQPPSRNPQLSFKLVESMSLDKQNLQRGCQRKLQEYLAWKRRNSLPSPLGSPQAKERSDKPTMAINSVGVVVEAGVPFQVMSRPTDSAVSLAARRALPGIEKALRVETARSEGDEDYSIANDTDLYDLELPQPTLGDARFGTKGLDHTVLSAGLKRLVAKPIQWKKPSSSYRVPTPYNVSPTAVKQAVFGFPGESAVGDEGPPLWKNPVDSDVAKDGKCRRAKEAEAVSREGSSRGRANQSQSLRMSNAVITFPGSTRDMSREATAEAAQADSSKVNHRTVQCDMQEQSTEETVEDLEQRVTLKQAVFMLPFPTARTEEEGASQWSDEEPVEPMEVEKRHKEDPNKRLMSQKHLVELSAKVQRQHEQSIQAQRDRRTHRAQSPIKQHPSPFDEGHSKAASRIGSSIDREARSRVGSATIVSVQSRAPTVQSRVSSGVARVAERIGSATYSMPKGSQVFTGAQIIPRARNAEESSDSSDTHIKSLKAEIASSQPPPSGVAQSHYTPPSKAWKSKQYTVPSSTAITEVTRQGTPAAYPPRAPDKDPVTMTTVPGFASIPVKKVMPKDMKPEPKPTPSKPPARPAANSPDPSSALANIGDLRKSLVEPPDRAKVPPEKTSRRETYVRELHARHPDSDNTATNQEAEEREEADRTGDKSPDYDPAHQNLEWRHRDPRHRPMPEFIPVAMEKISMKDLEMAPRNAPPRERPSMQQYLPQQYALERPQAQSREENPKVHSFGVGKMAGPFSREKQPAASASKQLTSSFQDIVCRRDREGAGATDDTDEQQESRENSGSSQEGRKLETTIERASTVPVRQSEWINRKLPHVVTHHFHTLDLPNIYYGRLASPSRTWRMPTMFDHLQPGSSHPSMVSLSIGQMPHSRNDQDHRSSGFLGQRKLYPPLLRYKQTKRK